MQRRREVPVHVQGGTEVQIVKILRFWTATALADHRAKPPLIVVGLLFASGCAQTLPAPAAPGEPVYPKTDMAVGYRVDPAWPVGPLPCKCGGVSGVAVDTQDRVWVFNRGKVSVQAFSREGKLLEAWGEGLFKAPHGLRIDRNGDLWITDAALHVVRKYTPQGKLLLELGTAGEPGENDRHFNRPTDVAIAPDGDVFVADGYANNRVVHFDAQGRFVKAWGKLGVKPGEFSLPHGIASDSQGRLYVCDRNNARIQVFDRQGSCLAEWRNLLVPWCIWISTKDEIFVTGSSPTRWGEGRLLGVPPKDQLVMKLAADGRLRELSTFPMGETGREQPGQLNWLHGVAADSRGDLYLGDIQGCRVQKFVRLTTP
jgi:DNA-binding beta-propeller fold protein YncE